MDTVPTTRREARGPRRRNRGTIVKLTLAGFALVGIGAAATSAAWTDQANFKTDASSASVQLKAWNSGGSGCGVTPPVGYAATGACWLNADDASGAVTITDPNFILANLVPAAADRTLSTDLYLLNAGTSKLALTASCVGTGALFAQPSPLRVTLTASGTACASWAPATLAVGAQLPVRLNVVVPHEWWDNGTYKNVSGSLPVVFTGTAAP